MSCISASCSTAPSGALSKSEGTPKVLEKDKIHGEMLHHTKLKFSADQLINLNWKFDDMLKKEEIAENDNWVQVTTSVERLIQRLLCAVGNLDSRFSSKFLICLNKNVSKDIPLKYLVRLDTLSIPVLYPDDPVPSYEIQEFDSEGISPGFARIRLRNKTATVWAEFINSSGYLRRDKIQERYVELLALAAAGSWPTTVQEVDDSYLCGTPGKVLDAAILNYILHTKPEEQLFYSSATNFPDPRDFRLAIVDSPTGIRIRLGFQIPGRSGDVQVHLLLGIGTDSWPKSAAIPNSGHLTHYMGMTIYKAAATGMFLTATGCQTSSWQMQFPAASITLLQHYGSTSPVTLILKVLRNILQDIHSKISEEKFKYHSKLLSNTVLEEYLFKALEHPEDVLQAMVEWSTINLSRKVLQILDNIVGALRTQHIAGYYFPKDNLVGGEFREEEYLVEANRLYMYLANLHSLQISNTNIPPHISLESQAISRWSSLVSGLQPAGTTRASRFTRAVTGMAGLPGHYTQNQVEYIAEILEGVLELRQRTIQSSSLSSDMTYPEDSTEDIIYLLVTIISQAREQVFSDVTPSASSSARSCTRSRSESRKQKYSTRRRSQFDTAVRKLVEALRKDKSLRKKDMNDMAVVVCLLRWLHKSLDHSRRTLAPVLRAWLRRLGTLAHDAGTSRRLERSRYVSAMEEAQSLGVFSKVVCGGRSPAAALIEGVNKGWIWASNILSLVSLSPLRIIFTPSRGKVLRHILSLPSYEQKSKNSITMEEFFKDRKTSTLPSRCTKVPTNFKGGTIPRGRLQSTNHTHQELKLKSPLTETFQQSHRRGKLPGVTDLVQALVAFNKISILHELSSLLPIEDRRVFLTEIQHLCKMYKRQGLKRRETISVMLSTNSTQKSSKKLPPKQTYTPTEFVSDVKKEETKKEKDTLIGSCRAARIREDSQIVFHDNFKLKSLFNNESYS